MPETHELVPEFMEFASVFAQFAPLFVPRVPGSPRGVSAIYTYFNMNLYAFAPQGPLGEPQGDKIKTTKTNK